MLQLAGWCCLYLHSHCNSRDEDILTLIAHIQGHKQLNNPKVVRTWPQHSGLPWRGHTWRPSWKLEADLHHRILLTVQTWFASQTTRANEDSFPVKLTAMDSYGLLYLDLIIVLSSPVFGEKNLTQSVNSYNTIFPEYHNISQSQIFMFSYPVPGLFSHRLE